MAAFGRHGFEPHIFPVRSGPQVHEAIQFALREATGMVVVGGGDGTLSAAAARLVHTGVALAVLPTGTLNHFARDLALPTDLDSVASLVAAGHTTQVDVGELNGDIFINNSSLGLYPRIVEYREEQEKMGRHRLLAFGAACLVALRRYPFLDIRLRCEGKDLRLRTPFLFIGNNVYEMEGLRLGHRRRLVADTLSLYVAHRTGRLGLLRLAMSALVGRLRLNHDMDVFESREVVIDTRRKRIHVALDGEVIRISPPLVYKVLPKALTVVVPPGR